MKIIQMCDKKFELILNSTIDTTVVQNMDNLKLNSKVVGESNEDLGEGTSGLCELKFSKQSIDRFSDDLIEKILSYLSFSDKVMFESVSKQWKKVIYNKQTELHLNRSETEETNTLNKLLKPMVIEDYTTGYANYAGFRAIDKYFLKTILKKCKNIKSIVIDCYIDGEDLEIFGKYCPLLESIVGEAIGFNEQNILEFGSKYGHRLKKLQLYNSIYMSAIIKKFLNYCKNLTEIHCEESTTFISEDKLFLPQIEDIYSLDIRTENLNHLKILCDKYYNKLRKIRIYCHNLNGFEPQISLTNISGFKNLEKLELYLSSFDKDVQKIDENIKKLSENCTQLKDLDLTITSDDLVTEQLFFAFEKFMRLEKLNLYIRELDKKLDGSIECFRLCSNLKVLNISYRGLSPEFFEEIQAFLPNLRSVEIDCETEFTDNSIFPFSKLKNLREFRFRKSVSSNKLITDESICQLINSSENIEVILFSARPKITNKTIEALIDLALKNPRKEIEFFCGFSNDGDEAEFPQIDLNSYANSLPQNLDIAIIQGDLN
jgi:hypothetical protein